MPHTIWKGSVSFGLVSIPVRLTSATQEQDPTSHQVHVADGGRIRYRRVCELDGEEVAFSDIGKGYPTDDGRTVVLEDDDLDELPVSTTRTVEVSGFVPFDQIDPTSLSRAYYASPTGDAKPYVLLRDALAASGLVGVVKIALRQRERLALLRARGEALVIQTMMWPDEVRTPEITIDDDVTVRQQEMDMASSYIDTLTGDFEPDDYVDDYRDALKSLVRAKAEGDDVRPAQPEESQGAEVVDLMEALSRSVQAAKGGTKRATKSATEGGEPAKATKKAAPKKAPAKKSGTKKASAKKAS